MNKHKFTLTEQHIKLLKSAYVSWWDCETGAPCIDCKRPYGNSYVPGDIHKILNNIKGGLDRELTDEEENKYLKLHSETETALQIVLTTGKFKAGKYQRPNFYFREWKLIE